MGEQLYDVIVYEIESRKITNIVGRGMRLEKGHYNAEKRLETILMRMNEFFDAEIVPTGQYKVGDIHADKFDETKGDK